MDQDSYQEVSVERIYTGYKEQHFSPLTFSYIFDVTDIDHLRLCLGGRR